jgi:hypothetical protein
MKFLLGTPALLGAASAMVIPLERAEPCQPLNSSVVPEPNPNTPSTFASYPFYSLAASVVTDPPGFESTVKNAEAAVRSATYMYHLELDYYEPLACAQHCNKFTGCDSCKRIG